MKLLLFHLARRCLRVSQDRKYPGRIRRLMTRVHRHLRRLSSGPAIVRVGPDIRFKVHSLYDDCIGNMMALNGGWERTEAATLVSLLAPGECAMDVGANIGIQTVYLSRAVGPGGRVLAFEPDPKNLKLLEENLRLNGCHNVEIHAVALGENTGRRSLYLCDTNHGFQGFADLARTGQSIEVQVQRAADVLGTRFPQVLKMDVEGAEPMVMKGFDRWPDAILLEFSTDQLRAMGEDPKAFVREFISRGYALYWIFNAEFGHTRTGPGSPIIPTSEEDLLELAERTRLDYNVLAVRGDRYRAILERQSGGECSCAHAT